MVISNPSQRRGKGGRPALIVNKTKFQVHNLTQTDITIPWGVEIVWAVLTPLGVTSKSTITKIVIGSLYSKPNSKKKTALLDHIAEVYQAMCAKYSKGLQWILAGDFNDLKDQGILSISPTLKQVVTKPTRMNPPRILDKIITSMADFYQEPVICPPLDNDPEKNGKPSDHCIVMMSAINVINNKSNRTFKEVTFRPITEVGISKMSEWLVEKDWSDMKKETVDNQAANLMHILQVKTDEFFPQKKHKISNDNQPFFTRKLENLKRKKQREFSKNRKSEKWRRMENAYQDRLANAKMSYYKKEISKLKKSDPKKWYYWLKRLVSADECKESEVNVEVLNHLQKEEQAESIADEMSKVRNEYEPLNSDSICIPEFTEKDIPVVSVQTVESMLKCLKTNKSITRNDIPPKILKDLPHLSQFPSLI